MIPYSIFLPVRLYPTYRGRSHRWPSPAPAIGSILPINPRIVECRRGSALSWISLNSRHRPLATGPTKRPFLIQAAETTPMFSLTGKQQMDIAPQILPEAIMQEILSQSSFRFFSFNSNFGFSFNFSFSFRGDIRP